MTVYFVRHGHAQRSADAGDANRSLSAQGRRQTRAVGKLLRERAEPVDRVYCSPLVRAVQTSEILVDGFDCDDAVEVQPVIAFSPTLSAFLSLIDSCPSSTHGLAIIGHEPTLSDLVTHLLKENNPTSTWRGFSPSQVVAFQYNRTNHSWAFKWQILPNEPEHTNSI